MIDPGGANLSAFSESLHLCLDLRIVGWAFTPDGLVIEANELAHPTLRDVVIPHRPERRILPFGCCR